MSRDDGYALLEVFVAAAIAALTVATVFAGLANGMRASAQADASLTRATEAASIEAGLRAGISAASLAQTYPGWRIDVSPIDRPVDPRTGGVITQARLVHQDRQGRITVQLTMIYVEDGALLRDSGV